MFAVSTNFQLHAGKPFCTGTQLPITGHYNMLSMCIFGRPHRTLGRPYSNPFLVYRMNRMDRARFGTCIRAASLSKWNQSADHPVAMKEKSSVREQSLLKHRCSAVFFFPGLKYTPVHWAMVYLTYFIRKAERTPNTGCCFNDLRACTWYSTCESARAILKTILVACAYICRQHMWQRTYMW